MIRQKAVDRENGTGGAKRGRVSLDLAAGCLFDHWAKVFRDPKTGAPMTIGAAKVTHPGLFDLHMAIKNAYTRVLKRHRKDSRDHQKPGQNNRKVSDILPRDMAALYRLIEVQQSNSDLAALVRLGRIIHFEASEGAADSPEFIDRNWPTDVTNSRYWTSDGQAEIKRAESFVRVWRHVLAYAGLTLKDWASMQVPFEGDILGSGRTAARAISHENFDLAAFDRKLELLFGNRAELMTGDGPDARKNLLHAAILGTMHLRHRAFHFKGRGMFLAGLDGLAGAFVGLPGEFAGLPLKLVRGLWEADASDRIGRLKATLRGANVEHFFNDQQNRRLLYLLGNRDEPDLPLPRFSRVLVRAENAWSKDKSITLPPPANRRALEAPSRLCQYTVLKLLYQRPFRIWLNDRPTKDLCRWIDRAVERATKAAHVLNFRDDEIGRQVITARAASLPRPSEERAGIRDFFFDLSSATASEMRVQRGYESDGEKACEQAGYIDDLLCDVMTLALTDYLGEQELQWVLKLAPDLPLPADPISNIDEAPSPQADLNAADWQVSLYFLLHLIPVDEAGRLLHQLAKWEITAGRNAEVDIDERKRLQVLLTVLKLYLDMHDAKFEGGKALVGCDAFHTFFETRAGFGLVFPLQLSPEQDRRIPRRGLREIMRFGHLPLMQSLTPRPGSRTKRSMR